MANTTLLKRVANQVEELLTEYPHAKQRFKEQIEIYNHLWSNWRKAKDNEHQPYYDADGKNFKEGYVYDKDFTLCLRKCMKSSVLSDN